MTASLSPFPLLSCAPFLPICEVGERKRRRRVFIFALDAKGTRLPNRYSPFPITSPCPSSSASLPFPFPLFPLPLPDSSSSSSMQNPLLVTSLMSSGLSTAKRYLSFASTLISSVSQCMFFVSPNSSLAALTPIPSSPSSTSSWLASSALALFGCRPARCNSSACMRSRRVMVFRLFSTDSCSPICRTSSAMARAPTMLRHDQYSRQLRVFSSRTTRDTTIFSPTAA
mmetsp:Transcript_20624/g.53028  ORF Transcript_20624/g.53028 Transcript_20624/m.53028 type:complete len:227 (+) Transcript_20624:907-1587(+)